jgi:hypothetical protein
VPEEIPRTVEVVMRAVYDLVLEISATTGNPAAFQHRFFKEVTRVELAMLKAKADVALPTFRHPLPAMKTYRSLMCGTSMYEDQGNAKIRLRDHNIIEIRYWQCPYADICKDHEEKVCLRTHSLMEAADLLSPTTFDEIEDLRFSEEGNCIVFVRVNFTGDLREIDAAERVIDERPCIHLTRDEAASFLLRTLMSGAEYACNHLPEVNVRHSLRDLAKRIDEAGLAEKDAAEYPFLRRGLKKWRQGKNAFTRHD